MFDFARNYSIYKLPENYNEYLLTVNCSFSIIHNRGKYKRDNSSFDLEGYVNKVFNHFSSPAETVTDLQEIFHFEKIECHKIMRHALTRWLYFADEDILNYNSHNRSYILSLKGTCPETNSHRLFFLSWLLKLRKFYFCSYYWNIKYCGFHTEVYSRVSKGHVLQKKKTSTKQSPFFYILYWQDTFQEIYHISSEWKYFIMQHVNWTRWVTVRGNNT